MKNYRDSDYAVNKNAEGIVYRFANQTIEITLADYLRENPDKTPADFAELKALSDTDYYNTDRSDYRQTWKNTSFENLDDDESAVLAVQSVEDEVIGKGEQEALLAQRQSLAALALDKLTDTQRRRYIQYHVHGKTTREIAAFDGVSHVAVSYSIEQAETRIKKYFSNAQKTT